MEVAEDPGLEQPAFFVAVVAQQALKHPFYMWDTTADVGTTIANNAHGKCGRKEASCQMTSHHGK